jgi:hypothetical protein
LIAVTAACVVTAGGGDAVHFTIILNLMVEKFPVGKKISMTTVSSPV